MLCRWLEGCQAGEGLEALGEVVGADEDGEVFLELFVGLVVVAADSGVLERAVHSLVLTRPPAAPNGYTPLILLTEWLTLNCRGDWASRAKGDEVVVRYASRADYSRVAERWLKASHLAAE